MVTTHYNPLACMIKRSDVFLHTTKMLRKVWRYYLNAEETQQQALEIFCVLLSCPNSFPITSQV